MLRSRLHAIALLSVVLAGCSAGPERDQVSSTDTGLDVQLGWSTTTDGQTMALPAGRAVQGRVPPSTDGTVLINFWGSWCGPCKEEMPLLQRLADGGDVEVIGVSRDRFPKYAQEFLRSTGATFPNVLDPDGDYMTTFSDVVPRQALPSSVLMIDGKVVAAHIGAFKRWSDLTTDRPG